MTPGETAYGSSAAHGLKIANAERTLAFLTEDVGFSTEQTKWPVEGRQQMAGYLLVISGRYNGNLE